MLCLLSFQEWEHWYWIFSKMELVVEILFEFWEDRNGIGIRSKPMLSPGRFDGDSIHPSVSGVRRRPVIVLRRPRRTTPARQCTVAERSSCPPGRCRSGKAAYSLRPDWAANRSWRRRPPLSWQRPPARRRGGWRRGRSGPCGHCRGWRWTRWRAGCCWRCWSSRYRRAG